MCGIAGLYARDGRGGAEVLEALRRLEYRGYDSAGILSADVAGLRRRRASGKLEELERVLAREPLWGEEGSGEGEKRDEGAGRVWLGHTRWATHGAPSEANAHPHVSGLLGLAHNGIIENARELRAELLRGGVNLESETDTEAAVCMVRRELDGGADMLSAALEATKRMRGAYAMAFGLGGEGLCMLGVQRGAPLALGYGEGRWWLASDAAAMHGFAEELVWLENGEAVFVDGGGARIIGMDGEEREAGGRRTKLTAGPELTGLRGYRRYMEREIFEQPDTLSRALSGAFDLGKEEARERLGEVGEGVKRVVYVGCGTAAFAAMTASWWTERLCGIPSRAELASEFREREGGVLEEGTLGVFVSQSGETADTLGAMRFCRERGIKAAAVVNEEDSTIGREADVVLGLGVGREIAVASTKTFTAQLGALGGLAISLGRRVGGLGRVRERELTRGFMATPGRLAWLLERKERYEEASGWLSQASSVVFMGRGLGYPLALEGALKMKEASYVHAEGFASGELKHGAIALLDGLTPVVALAPPGASREKLASGVMEAAARGAPVVLMGDEGAREMMGDAVREWLPAPETSEESASLVYAGGVQMLSYYVGLARGADVDRPRNLAKSVTVE